VSENDKTLVCIEKTPIGIGMCPRRTGKHCRTSHSVRKKLPGRAPPKITSSFVITLPKLTPTTSSAWFW
jgi:hypothetical protein